MQELRVDVMRCGITAEQHLCLSIISRGHPSLSYTHTLFYYTARNKGPVQVHVPPKGAADGTHVLKGTTTALEGSIRGPVHFKGAKQVSRSFK